MVIDEGEIRPQGASEAEIEIAKAEANLQALAFYRQSKEIHSTYVYVCHMSLCVYFIITEKNAVIQ